MKAKFLRNPYFFAGILLLSLGFVYGGQFANDTFLNYDDRMVIESFRDIHSLHEYFQAFLHAKISDVQPVRDLVTGLDFFVLNFFHLSIFHLTNVIIWFFALLGLRRLIVSKADNGLQDWLLAMLVLIAVNPLYVTSVAWLSARKHILATCFIVWSTVFFFDCMKALPKKRALFFSCLCYALAIFSQPIVLLWPLIFGLILYFSKQLKEWKILIPFFILMGLGVLANSLYYSSEMYLGISYGIPKVSAIYSQVPLIRLFAVGRYFFQIICPYWTSITIYNLSSWRGLAGILLLPLIFYLFWKILKPKTVLLGTSIFVLTLFPVVWRMTQIFGSDTYLVLASLGVYFLLAESSYVILRRFKFLNYGLFGILFVFFLLVSRGRADAFEDDVSVFGEAWKLEQSIYAGNDYLGALMYAQKNREAAWYAEEILQAYPNDSEAQGVISIAIANDPALTLAEKIEKIYGYHFFSPMALDTLAKLEFDIKNYKNAEQLLLKVLDSEEWYIVLRGQQESFAAKIYASCKFAKEAECDAKVAAVQSKTGLMWDQKKFEAQIKNLGI